MTPIVDEECYGNKPSMQASRIFPSFASRKDPPHSEATELSPTTTTDEVTKIHATTPALSEVSSHESKPICFTPANESSGRIRRWYRWASRCFHVQRWFVSLSLSGLTSKKKTLLRVGIVAGALLVGATIIILLLLFLVILHSSCK